MKGLISLLGIGLPSFFAFGPLSSAVPIVDRIEDMQAGWNEVKPGGATRCARGGEFSFFVSPGNSDKVLIDFIGGGACWNGQTCARDTATFSDNVEHLKRRYENGDIEGIYQRDRDDNPFKDYNHVVIPYCTGDIHWGNNEITYTDVDGEDFTIQHKGAVNAKAVLSWVAENIINPNKVVVTGCSAGSYGSIYWTPEVRRLFPRADFKQLGDSGVGIITERFFHDSFPKWNATAAAPRWIPGLNPDEVDWSTLGIHDLYTKIGRHYPSINLSQYTSAFDDNQTFYFEIMGGAPENWSPNMFDTINEIEDSLSSFRSFIAPGVEHCILPYDEFYSVQSGGVSFSSWLKNYIDGEQVASVVCEHCDPDGVGH